MKILGIIAEYNPFHNGHLYHINKAKEMINPDITIVVMSGNTVQRGEFSIIDKWTRSQIAIDCGVDIVIELPSIYVLQSADYFAKGAITLLNEMGVTDIVFGSESSDINSLLLIANTIKDNPTLYNNYVKKYMKEGLRYADACNKALSVILNKQITTPNDLLGLSYTKEVINNNYPIKLHTIKRTSNYHNTSLENIASATSLRVSLKNNEDVSSQLPYYHLYKDHHLFDFNQFYPFIKYHILTNKHLNTIHLVDEGIENLLYKHINHSHTLNEFINHLTSKRYTYSRISRMLMHILLNTSKDDINDLMTIDYIRLLGFSKNGQEYIRKQKKNTNFKIISNITKHSSKALDLEIKIASILSLIDNSSLDKEYKSIPYQKKVN